MFTRFCCDYDTSQSNKDLTPFCESDLHPHKTLKLCPYLSQKLTATERIFLELTVMPVRCCITFHVACE